MTSMVASSIILKAYQDAGKVALGAALSANQSADGLDRVNDIINYLQTKGLKLFLDSETTVTLVASQQKYTFSPTGDVVMAKPLELRQASYWDANDVSRPLLPIARSEWMGLSNRTETGQVNQYFVEQLYDRLNLYLWMTPDATAALGSLRVVLRTQATNPATVNASILFPIEWALTLRWMLADELAGGMPDSVQARCARNAKTYLDALEDWDVETVETVFQPDTRQMTTSASRFR